MAAWLAPLAEYAAQRGVQLAIANALFFHAARDMWLLMEQANDPAIGVCWDALSAALAQEMPAVSVPMLGNRIHCVQVRDAALKAGTARLCRLGEGDVRLADLFRRLQGIGYRGWVTVGGEIAAGEADPIDALAQSLATLRQWTEAQTPATAPAAKKKPAAAAVTP
jgi:sugar phosphate isomerase/epimerase